MLAPILASAAVGCVFAATAARRHPVLADVAVDDRSAPPSRLERIGSAGLARRAVGAPELSAAIAAARWSVPVATVVGSAVTAAAIAVAACIAIGGPVVALAPILAAVALRAPAFVVARGGRRRARAIDRDVPLLLDVISLASYAGLPPPAALRRAVDVIDGPLADELSAALADVDLGSRWRERLQQLSADLRISDLERTVAVLVRSESIGSSTTEPISILAEEIRGARRAAAGERARKAPVQMLFPLVFLVLPAFLLLTFVPVLVATLGSIR
ncbi:MAG: type II secretion system F family protein [Actinomycetota bacterium]